MLAAMIGLGTGYSFATYFTGVMGPHMMGEFGWTKDSWADVHSMSILMMFAFPIIGRLTDMLGVRRVAMIGVAMLPITFLLISRIAPDPREVVFLGMRIQADLAQYVSIYLLQALFCITTTATVYARIVVAHIERARGLALALAIASPALVQIFALPLISGFVETHGWRSGYVALAVFCGIAGTIALLMMPTTQLQTRSASITGTIQDYKLILGAWPFWVLVLAMLLCNLPQVLVLSQINVLLADNGVATADAAAILPALPMGMLVGRFVCGAAIDRFPPHLVATISLAIPSLGLFLLASELDTIPMLTFGVFCVGLAYGAEGDLVAYIVSRVFGVKVYSSVMGLMTAAIAIASSSGALVLGWTLRQSDTFTLFLQITGVAVLGGSLLFLLLGGAIKQGARHEAHATA